MNLWMSLKTQSKTAFFVFFSHLMSDIEDRNVKEQKLLPPGMSLFRLSIVCSFVMSQIIEKTSNGASDSGFAE